MPADAPLDEAFARLFAGVQSKAEAATVFRRMDKDSSGQLDTREFKLAAAGLGVALSDADAALIIGRMDANGDGMVSIGEFLDLAWLGKLQRVRQKFRAASYTMGKQDARKLFRHYDRDNSGGLEFDEFRGAVRRDAKLTSDFVSDPELVCSIFPPPPPASPAHRIPVSCPRLPHRDRF